MSGRSSDTAPWLGRSAWAGPVFVALAAFILADLLWLVGVGLALAEPGSAAWRRGFLSSLLEQLTPLVAVTLMALLGFTAAGPRGLRMARGIAVVVATLLAAVFVGSAVGVVVDGTALINTSNAPAQEVQRWMSIVTDAIRGLVGLSGAWWAVRYLRRLARAN